MEIRRMLRGENTGFFPRTSPKTEEKKAGSGRPSTDRVELSRQWVKAMEEQRSQAEAALLAGTEEKKKSGGILDMLDEPSAGEQELDALSEELDVQMKCLKIAMNMMKGKKVPPEDERYLMEHDPSGYKMAMAMKVLVKEDKKECKSVLDDEDRDGEKTQSADSGESAPTETASSGGGEAASAEGGTE